MARGSAHIDIALGAVEIPHRLEVLGDAVRLKRVAQVHRQSVGADLGFAAAGHMRGPHALRDLSGAEELVAGEFDRSDLVFDSLIDNEPDDHGPGGWVEELDVFDLEIN